MNNKLPLTHVLRQIIANFSKKERVLFIVFIIILIIGIIGGIIKLSNNQATIIPLHGGTYREAVVGSPRFINPVLNYSDTDKDITTLVYSGLVRIDESGNPIPDLAESWSVSADGKNYTVTLKPKLVFHDKKPLTADDVIFTISKIQDPALKSPLRVSWEGVVASSPDDRTVVFNLQKPYAGFISQLTLGILPKHIWNEFSLEEWQTSLYNTEPIGSGPYELVSVSRSHNGIPEEYRFSAFKKFALGKAYIDEVIFKIYANKNDASDAFDSGSVDSIALVAPEIIDSISNRSTAIITAPLPRVFGIFFNPIKNKIFAESAVIQAIRVGVDKQNIIETIFNGYAEPLAGPLPSSVDTSTISSEDKLILAGKILDNAGWKMNSTTGIREKTIISGNGKTKVITPLSFSLSTANTKELEKSAEILTESLKPLGIAVQVKVFEIGILNEQVIRSRDFDALLFGQVIKHDTDIFAFWHSSQKSDPGLNITGYSNKTVDTLLESAIKEPYYSKRAAMYDTIAQQLGKDAPVVFLYTPELTYLINNSIHHVVLPPISSQENRLALISKWYAHTDHVWNLFVKNSN